MTKQNLLASAFILFAIGVGGILNYLNFHSIFIFCWGVSVGVGFFNIVINLSGKKKKDNK